MDTKKALLFASLLSAAQNGNKSIHLTRVTLNFEHNWNGFRRKSRL